MIRLEKVNKFYPMGEESVHALKDVSLHIAPHEFVALCGPSGSGKSTLMNIIGCLDLPDSGEYMLDGRPVGSCTERELASIRSRSIGFIFQQFNLLDKLSALENVELPLIYQHLRPSERISRAREALELVGLGERLKHKPSQLSGGQQQRVAIARALATRPSVILADEPTGNLDSRAGQDVMRLIHRLSDEGNTIALITHNMDIAREAQRTLYVYDGEVSDRPKGGR